MPYFAATKCNKRTQWYRHPTTNRPNRKISNHNSILITQRNQSCRPRCNKPKLWTYCSKIYVQKSVKPHLKSANKISKQSSYFAKVKPVNLGTKFRNKHANLRQEFSAFSGFHTRRLLSDEKRQTSTIVNIYRFKWVEPIWKWNATSSYSIQDSLHSQ